MQKMQTLGKWDNNYRLRSNHLASWLCCLSVHSTRYAPSWFHSCPLNSHVNALEFIVGFRIFSSQDLQEQPLGSSVHPFLRFSSQDIDLPLMKPPPPKPKMSPLDQQNVGKAEGGGRGTGVGVDRVYRYRISSNICECIYIYIRYDISV